MVLGRGAYLAKMAQSKQQQQGHASSQDTNASSMQHTTTTAGPTNTSSSHESDHHQQAQFQQQQQSMMYQQQQQPALGRGKFQRAQQPAAAATMAQMPPMPDPVAHATSRLQSTQVSGTDSKKAKHDRSIFVNANFLKIVSNNPAATILMYSVKFFPEVQSKGVRFSKVRKISGQFGCPYLFSGTTMYTFGDLGPKFEQDGVIIEKIKPVTFAEAGSVSALALREIFNNLGLVRLGRSYFDLSTPVKFQKHGLEIYSGYTVLVNQLEAGAHVSIDTTHKVIRTESVYEKLKQIYKQCSNPQQITQGIADEIVGSTIITRYNNRTYVAVDIDWNMTPNSTFKMHDGSEISFGAYYKSNYTSAVITDFDQPMVVAQVKSDKVYLVPELCYLTGLTEKMRRDFTLMKDLAEKLKADPQTRRNDYQAFSHLVMNSERARQILNNWALNLEPTMVQCPAQQITNVQVQFKNNKSMPIRNADFGMAVTKEAPIEPVDLQNWAIVYNKKNTQNVNTFMNHMKRFASTFNMRVAEPTRIEVTNERIEHKREAIKNLVQSNPNCQIVVTVLETSREDNYNVIKRISYCELPVPSQVIIAKTLNDKPKTSSVVAKILLQLNCKVGGALWSTFNFSSNNDQMICGMDVFHQRGQPSVVGLVSSMDSRYSKWHSKTFTHREGEEITMHFEQLLSEALVNFHACNNKLPNSIVLYRDGVGDGRIRNVIEIEYEQMKRACQQAGPNYNPKITIVVVHKRINTRIFFNQSGSGGSSLFTNAQPGTFVDSHITKPQYPNFYLVSQSTRQGTVSPTHYVIAVNGHEETPEQLQKLTYFLTYMYYNWPGAVRVPAPCQYAHKLAYMVGENLRKEPHDRLKNTLFYI